MRTILAAMAAFLAGCSATPYFEAGLGYKVNADDLLRPENGGGRNPTAHFEFGLEWDRGLSCGINHWSHVRDGGWPANNDLPETHKDELLCKKRWGGK